MTTTVERWGDDLAIRIPSAVAAEAGLGEGSRVELSLVMGDLVLSPDRPPNFRLEDLLAGVTDENRHGEWDAGPALGQERW